MGFNCLKATEQLLGDSFLLNTKSLGVTGTHLICLGKMKGQCILSFFCESFRALSLSRKFAQFSIKAVYVTMVGENLVPENASAIQKLKTEIFTHALKRNSPQVHIITSTQI